MNYTLNKFEKGADSQPKESFLTAVKRLIPLMAGEQRHLLIALVAILVTSAAALISPMIIGHTVDAYMRTKDYHGVLLFSGILLAVYIIGLGAQYLQTITMGGIGRRILFNLRNVIFNKLQALPLTFFNQNKAGDLISRINNDTDQLNQFFSQALMQFVGNFFLIIGIGVFLLILNAKLGFSALIPALGVLIITSFISPWVKKQNRLGLQSLGGLSAEIQESLENFQVIVAFNRLDYFRNKFSAANENNYKFSVKAGVANNIFVPLYGFAANLAQMITLVYGLYLITAGNLTLGLLISFILYVNNFYAPLRQLASVWSSLQLALAGFDRISEILALESDIKIIPAKAPAIESKFILEFKQVSFGYLKNQTILKDINLGFEKGKTYALVGPTGGGKTTTASLMARLYDPNKGSLFLDGRDLKSYSAAERVKKIGFIAQEPFLFTGTVRDNIVYGNEQYRDYSDEALRAVLEKENLSNLLARFENGLETKVSTSGNTISLGQKQLVAFIRAVLREPELLILDEATANIDTVTEQLLEETLDRLPASTTRIVIAHRLNTINTADQIYFVNSGRVIAAGSMENAIQLLLNGQRTS
jgi:ATP-binding cassette subfamily B protein